MAAQQSQVSKSTNVRILLTLFAMQTAFRTLGRVAPETAAAWAQRLFLTPRRHAEPAREKRWLAQARRSDVEVGGRRLAVWSWGEGEPVLLAHGWAGRAGQLGAFAEPLVAAGFRAVSFDMPGHGESEGKTSSLVEMGEAVAGMIEHLGPVRAVIAHSAGAAATTVAMRLSLPVGRLVFLAPPSDLGTFSHQFAGTLGMPERVRERMQDRIETHFGVRWAELTAATIAPTMDRPLLVFHDRDDREVPWESGRGIAELWPGARLVTTQGLGHQRILREPSVVSEAVELVRQALELDPSLGAARRNLGVALRRSLPAVRLAPGLR